ncbi:small conductance mechanosensitive channel [Nocardioides scoriae]|uniref:Small conductance mechanosensitive channel n=1 Tax=Nocardioides scoriae TaxID=642780 RepID=A0A1H1LT10_9ACTN|nr:mechanosensitive ion channel family protein [Nocardioides scoriae]SDR76909.1 small conductance mechanosensitive channel [Nocardioides scoriae]
MLVPTPLLDMPTQCRETDSWTCAAVYDWTGNEVAARAATWLIGKPAAIVGLLLGALVVRWLATKAVDRVVQRAEMTPLPGARAVHTRRAQRARSLGTLLKSILTTVVFGIAFVMVLSEIGVDVAPILASAGVLGLAIGFGAQNLVKDFLSGVMMMVEDQYGVGDVVDLGEAVGTVEAVGLRVTRLRDVNGTVWYVRNGEILRVGNQSQNWARTVLDVNVGYTEDLVRVRRILAEVAHGLWEDEDYRDVVIEEPEVWGVENLGPDGVVVRVTLKTAPLEQWAVAREMRQRIKGRFDHEGIVIPLPQRVVWHHDAPPRPGDPRSGDQRPAPAE